MVVYFSSFTLNYHPRCKLILSNAELGEVWTNFQNNFLCLVFRNSRWDYINLFHFIFISIDSSFLITWEDIISIWWKLCSILRKYWHSDMLLMFACLDLHAIVINVSLIKDPCNFSFFVFASISFIFWVQILFSLHHIYLAKN